MADVAIVNRATVSAPKDYNLSANEELALKAVRAVIDGSGAAGAFSPTLQLVAPDGTVMWESTPTGSIAAGGSADVSWFPGLGGGAGGGGVQALVGARVENHAGQSIPNSTTTDLVYDTTAFDTDGMVNLGANNRILTVNTAGLYLVICETVWPYNSAGRRHNGITVNGYAAAGAAQIAADSRMPVWAPVGGSGGGAPFSDTISVTTVDAQAGDFFASGAQQLSGGSLTANGLAAGSNQDNFLTALLIGKI